MTESVFVLPHIRSLTLFFSLLVLSVAFGSEAGIPHLEKRGNVTQLIVDGKPYLALAGELHNSTSSSLAYMKPIWPKLADMHLNTVLAPVSWDLVEPLEGRFDWTRVDGMLDAARRHHLHLVLLWFGSWKNGLSHYTPDWVKVDTRRFPRAMLSTGTAEVLSTFHEVNWQADAKAFAAFMQHLHDVDAKQHTVLMIQVENEVGLLGDSRDRSDTADTAFHQPVPDELMRYLLKHKETLLPEFSTLWQATGYPSTGTWESVFGAGPKTDEVFMAWQYARYVNHVAEAGKKEYALPMYVNAWIVQPRDKQPGDYPSGGPQAHTHDLWRAGAPAIDILAPDIYLPNFGEVCARFQRSGTPLFIPESRAGLAGVANLFEALGRYHALGYSPFGIDSWVTNTDNDPLPHAYGLLQELSPLILEHQATGTIAGVSLTRQTPTEQISLGNYTLIAGLRTNRRSPDTPNQAYGLFIQLGPDEYLVAGGNLQVQFAAHSPGPQRVGLVTVEEGVYQDGKWIPGRTLNGDAVVISYDMAAMASQYRTGTGLRFRNSLPSLQRVKLYRFE